MLTSIELTPGTLTVSGAGVLKNTREPVLVILGAKPAGASLSCEVVFTHAGLQPGPYELADGRVVVIPPALVGNEARVHYSVTLEVKA